MIEPKIIYVFGHANINYWDFRAFYERALFEQTLPPYRTRFVLGDCRGTDTLAMEFLKNHPNVCVYHMHDKPRYLPDRFESKVAQWQVHGGFQTDGQRDRACIDVCTHYIGVSLRDGSGCSKLIRKLELTGKISLNKET